MKNLKSVIIGLFTMAFLLSPATSVLADKAEISPAVANGIGLVAFVALAAFSGGGVQGVHVAGIQKEAWVDYIIKRFWKDNAFLKTWFSDVKSVLAGRVVHIPTPGAKPTTVKNRSTFPATAVRRTDTDITYTLDEYSTDPTHIHNLDKIELSYDKMDDEYGEHVAAVNETSADDLLIKVCGTVASNMIAYTTGADIEASAPSATGNRKAVTTKDFSKMQKKFNKLNVPKSERYALLSSDMYQQLVDSLSETQSRDFSRAVDETKGIVGELYGFKIIERSSVAVATVTTNAIKALGAVGAAADNEVALFYHKNGLAFAMGEVKVFDNTDDPTYYGDVMSTALRSGGRVKNTNSVALLIQAAGS
ncbi:phage capsid protein [Pedobacter sp. SL55]|uniref:phage capsid protein n=1 Tax=Pedobacter sp. SL55 TaxID=2995161 RepID=UPI00226DBB6A|nr:phage capsid protein [Pedobacter sp. SL55]WAC40577.1 phage capsid protein [Pedobacter sp. SL55]